MKAPKKVKVGVHTYKVVIDRAAIDACSVAGGVESARLGDCNHENLTITLEPHMASSMLKETLLHEVLHACFGVIGAIEDVDDKTEEKLVLRLSPVLMGLLRENPKLIEYILDDK
jgi:hypothetical protein